MSQHDAEAIAHWQEAVMARVAAGRDLKAEAEAMMIAAHAAQLLAIGPRGLAVQMAETARRAGKLADDQEEAARRATTH